MEMLNRLSQTCARWSVMGGDALACRQNLINQQPVPFRHPRPRRFAGRGNFLLGPSAGNRLVLCLKVHRTCSIGGGRLKRGMDFLLLLGGIVILPFLVLIALAIKVESRGPVFFRQSRIGRDGQTIHILKFRTMVRNAEEVLQQYLETNPELREEWKADQKLRNDPRITRVGAWLRRTSLDELPQLWNVLKGEMSLVGPRPIVENEIIRYGSAFASYMRVRPGMTGLWQVSGRNDLSYKQRVHLDRFYICNWSTWLDLLILAKTLPVVLGRKGAY